MKYLIIIGISIAVLLFLGRKWIKVYFAQDYHQMLESLYSNSVPLQMADSLQNLEQFLILDTRAFAEYEASHLPNAIWTSYPDAKLDILKEKDKNTPILLYCSVGYRSEKVGEQVQAMGFTQVFNLYGGIFEWANQGKVLRDSENKTTTKVHGYNPSWGKWLNKNVEVVYDE